MQAEQRRLIVAEIVARNPMALVRRGLAASLARSLGVHRSTILRDIARSFYAPRMCEFRCNGQLLYTVGREWGGGPVVSVVGPDGNEIQGEARRNIIRGLPRYWRKRR